MDSYEYLQCAYEYLEGKIVDIQNVIQDISESKYCENGDPVLFSFAIDQRIFLILERHSINFLQVSKNKKYNLLLHADEHMNLLSFKWLAHKFKKLGAIDMPEIEGITALSSCIKLGDLDRARMLLECGASISTVAKVEHYGGRQLSIPIQALYSISSEGQSSKIEAFKLLQEFGYAPSLEDKCELIKMADLLKCSEVKNWIEKNL